MVMAEFYGQRTRRKFVKKEKEKEDEIIPTPIIPMKVPIILAKPSNQLTPRNNIDGNSTTKLENHHLSDKPQPAAILVKPRKDAYDSVSNNHVTRPVSSVVNNEGNTPVHRNNQRVSNESGLNLRQMLPPDVGHSVKIVDESLTWLDIGNEILMDQSNFLVVGVMGMQGVGKSTILSHLAGDSFSDQPRSLIFKPQMKDPKDAGANMSFGLDMYATKERMILLDSQAMLSSSVLDSAIRVEKKYSVDYSNVDNGTEIQSVQVATFLMSVCNVVVIVVDWFIDENLARVIQIAEMLRPITQQAHLDGSSDEEHKKQQPHIGRAYGHKNLLQIPMDRQLPDVFVLNKADSSEFCPNSLLDLDRSIKQFMTESKLKFMGMPSMKEVTKLPSVRRMVHAPKSNFSNLFVLPNYEESEDQDGILGLLTSFRGHLGYGEQLRSMRNRILSLTRSSSHSNLSEKKWFQYAAKSWEVVRKSQLVSEYSRLLS